MKRLRSDWQVHLLWPNEWERLLGSEALVCENRLNLCTEGHTGHITLSEYWHFLSSQPWLIQTRNKCSASGSGRSSNMRALLTRRLNSNELIASTLFIDRLVRVVRPRMLNRNDRWDLMKSIRGLLGKVCLILNWCKSNDIMCTYQST